MDHRVRGVPILHWWRPAGDGFRALRSRDAARHALQSALPGDEDHSVSFLLFQAQPPRQRNEHPAAIRAVFPAESGHCSSGTTFVQRDPTSGDDDDPTHAAFRRPERGSEDRLVVQAVLHLCAVAGGQFQYVSIRSDLLDGDQPCIDVPRCSGSCNDDERSHFDGHWVQESRSEDTGGTAAGIYAQADSGDVRPALMHDA